MKTFLFLVSLLIPFLSTVPLSFAGNRCEVIDFEPYERPGVAYEDGIYFQIIEKCAEVVIKNTGDSHWFATDIKVTALFQNRDVKKGEINGEQDRLQKVEPGKTYSTTVCFGADPAQIKEMDCDR
jgi:hypothetical protein